MRTVTTGSSARSVGERRLTAAEAGSGEWLDAAELIIEVIDVAEADDPMPEATRIVAAAAVQDSSD
jgi:hypothetical protein